jgi:3,4-dihydroxy-9,10-secoandrosta-1,3,5(10)-triene-9,17-dione 4,5-dioxygenase
MEIRGLGYVGVDVTDVDAWRAYAELLGTMTVGCSEQGFGIKIDERRHRVLVGRGDADGLAFTGWELADASALEQACHELEAAGHPVLDSTELERAERGVRELVRTVDPSGIVVELFAEPIDDHRLFVSPTGVSGFVTGDMGMGHIVVGTDRYDDAVDFYRNRLGFRVSDYMPGGARDVVFLHCNPRHHSLALVAADAPQLYHFMLEARTLDDVGYTLDRLLAAGAPISAGLGRHPNDLMVSFYGRSPSGFDVEFGCGGRRVDDATWTVGQISKASLWGHRPPAAS